MRGEMVVAMVAAAVAAIFSFLTRGILFYTSKTDNELIIKAAAQAGHWGWPSGMHQFACGKAHMKEFAVVLLAGLQWILRDRTSDYPLVVLCIIANAISAFLLFIIAAHYWNTSAALFIFALFMVSFWPALIALWGGVVAVAQAVSLSAIYCFQSAPLAAQPLRSAWYFLAGISIGLILFSSASSRKYLPLVAAAFFWSLRLDVHWPSRGGLMLNATQTAVMTAALSMVLIAGVLRIILPPLVKAIYEQRALHFLDRLIKNRQRSLEEYLAISDTVWNSMARMALVGAGYLLISLGFAQDRPYWTAHLAVLAGGVITVFIFVFPHLKDSLIGYYVYSQYGKPVWRSRFYEYRDYFLRIGRPVADDMRGAGWPWVARYFHCMLGVQTYLFVIAVLIVMGNVFMVKSLGMAVVAMTMILLSLSPILMAELTKAVQVGRSYYPGFIGLLFLIGYAFFILDQNLPMYRNILWLMCFIVVLYALIWNGKIFFGDVFPARMSVRQLIKTLRRLNIKEFYTYDTVHNEAFVKCIPQDTQKEWNIKFIQSIKEVVEGHVVIPPTNTRSSIMYDFAVAKNEKNKFDEDPLLDEMIETRDIATRALACFETLGSSRIWVHEGEVPSYRDLILHEITDEDYYRGKAWLLKI